jgi:hypothetical protein
MLWLLRMLILRGRRWLVLRVLLRLGRVLIE